MGLLSAISNAVSGLNVNQQNLDVLSQNIANANTPNYSNEVVNQQAAFISGQGAGVTVASITRTVNDFLNSEVRAQTTANSSASAVQGYYQDIENYLGQPGGTSSIDQSVTAFFTAVQDLANSPTVSGQTTVVNTATAAATQISGLAGELYGLQLQSDNDITSAISSVNADLTTLNTVNMGIEHAAATNQSTAGLLDQRDAALNDLAQYLDISPTYQEDGEITVNTTAGTTLLTPTSLTQLSYTPANGTQTFVNNDALSPLNVVQLDVNGNPIGVPTPLATGGVAASITTSLTGGKIQGLLNVRDSVIPNILSQLDQLAGSLRDQVNAITNQGSSYPPPNSLTGDRLVRGTDATQWSGNVQVAVLNSDGSPITSPYADEPNGMPPLNLNLASLNTGQGAGTDSINGIINAINQYYGSPQNKLELGNLNNVQLGMVSNNVPDTGAGGTLSFDFNLNNISANSAAFTVTGITVLNSSNTVIASSGTSGVSALPSTVTVNSGQTLRTGSEGGAITVNLGGDTSSPLTVEATIQTVDSAGNTVTSTVSYTVDNNTTNVMNNLIGASNQTGSGTIVAPTSNQPIATAELVDTNGNPLPEINGSYGNQVGYLKIVADNSSQSIAINELGSQQLGLPNASVPQPGTNQGFSQYFGLNNLFNVNSLTPAGDTLRNSALNLTVESRIAGNPGLVSVATLSASNQPTTAGASPNLTYLIASGDNSVSQNLAGLATQLISFNATGGMPASTTTLSQYAGQLIANTSANSTQATNTMNDSQTLLTGFTQRAQAISGVNLDQELANTVIYQNAYTASTRVITVVSQMFTDLLGIIQ